MMMLQPESAQQQLKPLQSTVRCCVKHQTHAGTSLPLVPGLNVDYYFLLIITQGKQTDNNYYDDTLLSYTLFIK